MKKILFILTALTMAFCPIQAQKTASKAKKNSDFIVMKNPKATTGPEILKAIAADHKGKVAVIDFWATWCGPCMNAMKQIDPIKEKYLKDNKKNIDFVYVTGETSPIEKFNEAIPNIKGFHYRLSDQQYKDLLKHLGIRGIPTYMIFNADGTTSYDNITEGGYPGDEVMVAEIDKALAKK